MWVEVQRAAAAKRSTMVEGWRRCGLATASSPTKVGVFADAASMKRTGEDDESSSVPRKLQVRVFIAQGLSIQGCGSGPRLVFQHRRGPLSVCRSTFSADQIKLPRYPACSKGPRNTPGTDPAVMVNGRRGWRCRGPEEQSFRRPLSWFRCPWKVLDNLTKQSDRKRLKGCCRQRQLGKRLLHHF